MSKTVLFLCVGNSARSQMAEGIARSLAPAGTRVLSAGSQPAAVNPFAVQALDELEIDISGYDSTYVGTVDLANVDTVITLCEEEVCPTLRGGAERLHWPMPDPAAAEGSHEDRLSAFRQVRDQLMDRIAGWFGGPKRPARAG